MIKIGITTFPESVSFIASAIYHAAGQLKTGAYKKVKKDGMRRERRAGLGPINRNSV